MIRKLSIYISDVFLKNNSIKNNQYDFSIFGLEVILISVFQITGLIIFGIIIQKLDKLIFFFLPFMILRTSAGGLHANSAWRCFISSVVSFLIALSLENLFSLFNCSIYIILSVSFVLVYKYAPQDSVNKPFKEDEKEIYRCKSMQTFIVLSIVIISIHNLTNLKSPTVLSSIGILFESVTLLPILNNYKFMDVNN